jgi:6-phosphogluconolactonase
MNTPLPPAANAPVCPVRFHVHPNEEALTSAVTDALVAALTAGRARRGAALGLLSGGGTPVPVYRALAGRMADWSGITLALVDDRWVPTDDAGSNARMVRETLLAGQAGGPPFWPLTEEARDRAADVAAANAHYAASAHSAELSIVLLGMGDDGHTASLFPGSPDLDRALASTEAYVALDAHACPGAGAYPLRITLTPAGWSPARQRLLMIRGAHKRAVFERALAQADARALPVYAAAATGAGPLDVHWCE